MATMPASNKAAAMRRSKLVGAEGIGPSGRLGGLGGSSTPIPLNLRGGPPPRVEDACGSSSGSYSEKSYGMKLNTTPMHAERLEEAEDCFDRHPRGDGTARRVQGRHKFPAANGLHGAFIES